MPYKTKSDLPESVKHVLPSHAQDIYKEAFNSAWDQYKDKEDRRDDASREETAHKVAWAAVKKAIRAVLPCKWSVDCILSR
ncbi:MAG: putative cation transport regulator ChaB [Escherichia coli]|nr:putative cation transport regulator ChaB [Escherichia coli]